MATWITEFRVKTAEEDLSPLLETVKLLHEDATATADGPDQDGVFTVELSTPHIAIADVELARDHWIQEHPGALVEPS